MGCLTEVQLLSSVPALTVTLATHPTHQQHQPPRHTPDTYSRSTPQSICRPGHCFASQTTSQRGRAGVSATLSCDHLQRTRLTPETRLSTGQSRRQHLAFRAHAAVTTVSHDSWRSPLHKLVSSSIWITRINQRHPFLHSTPPAQPKHRRPRNPHQHNEEQKDNRWLAAYEGKRRSNRTGVDWLSW